MPAKEVILNEASLPHIISRIRALANELEVPVTHARNIIDKIRNDGELPGIESLIPLIYPQLDTLFDYIPRDSLVVTMNPEELEKIAKETEEIGIVEQMPKFEGRTLTMILAPNK